MLRLMVARDTQVPHRSDAFMVFFDSRLRGRGLTSLAASFAEKHCSGLSQADSSPACGAGAAGLDEVPVVVPAGVRQGDGSGETAARGGEALGARDEGVRVSCQSASLSRWWQELVPMVAGAGSGACPCPRDPAAAREPPRAAGQPVLGGFTQLSPSRRPNSVPSIGAPRAQRRQRAHD